MKKTCQKIAIGAVTLTAFASAAVFFGIRTEKPNTITSNLINAPSEANTSLVFWGLILMMAIAFILCFISNIQKH